MPDDPTEAQARAVIGIALEAERTLAKKLNAMKAALEAGNDTEALRIARDITKAKEPRGPGSTIRKSRRKDGKGAV